MNIEALLQDEAFAKEVNEAKNLEDVARLFNDKGIEVSAADIQKAMDSSDSGELSEENLEAVAGGLITPIVAGAVIGAYLIGKMWKLGLKY